jgi:hypothetical protein
MTPTQTVPDVERGGIYEGPDVVTGLQLYGTDVQYWLPRPSQPGHFELGSAVDQDIVIASLFVSARHCRLVRGPMGLRVMDRNSKNGTYLEGKRKKSFIVEPGKSFYLGARAHRLLALNDQMRVHYPALAAILGYEEEHAIPGETVSPCDLIVAAVEGSHMLITSEDHCDQARLARIIHAISLFCERPLVELDHAPTELEPEHELVTHRATTVVLQLRPGGPRLDPAFTARLFAPKHQTRVIALASNSDVAGAALGRYTKKLKHIWLEPPSARKQVIHRILDWMFEEAKSGLRVSAMTPANQKALRRHTWRDNFSSLRQAAERLTVLAKESSFRRASRKLGIPLVTLYDWYDKTMGLSSPLLREY